MCRQRMRRWVLELGQSFLAFLDATMALGVLGLFRPETNLGKLGEDQNNPEREGKC